MTRFASVHALITGAASGIGRETALQAGLVAFTRGLASRLSIICAGAYE